MEEHQFPLDLDSHLRRQVIMEIEREKVQTNVDETKNHLENWNTVIEDYNEISKEESYLPGR